jgi:tungstate transport system permease protein
MNQITESLIQAGRLLFGGDAELWRIILLSLQVSGLALLISTALGVPLGAALGLSRLRRQRLITALLYTGMGLPPVVVGLAIYLLLSRSGPLGALGWLFTPSAMVLAQIVIAFPVVAGLTEAAVQAVDPALRLQVRSLGATRLQETLAVLAEARLGLVAAILAAFGAIISEVGAVMMVGGNVAGRTRVFTTAIVLETRQGNFTLALALGGILLTITFLVNLVLLRLQGNIERH